MSNYADISALADDLMAAGEVSQKGLEGELDSISNQMLSTMTALVPVDTGKLKSTLHIEKMPMKRVIGTRHDIAEYDIYQEYGTQGPYEITAKAGKVLSFSSGGKQYFVKKVIHPGIRANPYVRPALSQWLETLGDRAALVGVQAVVNP